MNKISNSKELTKNHFNNSAENYNNSSDGRFVKCMYDEILERILKINPQNVLDIGCGNGNILKLLKEKTNSALYGIDLSDKMIAEAEKKLGKDVNLTVGDAEYLPYNDGQFDVIICNASFHHYPNPKIVLKEVKRILKKNGVFILGDPTAPFNWYIKIFNYFLKYSNSGDYKIYNQKEITDLLMNSGFIVENFKKINYRTFALNAINSEK